MLAKLLAEEIGIYGLKPEVLDDLLAGRRIELSVSVGSFWRAIEGDASRQDLETALQLLFKLFTVGAVNTHRSHVVTFKYTVLDPRLP